VYGVVHGIFPKTIVGCKYDMTSRDVISFLSAALTPLLGVIAVYIAYQQYRTNELRLRHDLYERRLRVYKAVQAYLVYILREAKVDIPQAVQMYADASEAAFLFDKDVQKYIDLLYKKGIQLRSFRQQLYRPDGSVGLPVGTERSHVADQEANLLKWFGDQLEESKELFRKHMGVK
jgi:hypothetical protein